MDATPKGRSSRRSRRGKKNASENTYAAPQQPEYWDAAAGQWVSHAPKPKKTQPSGPAQRRARRINPTKAADAQPYQGPRPDADWRPSTVDDSIGAAYRSNFHVTPSTPADGPYPPGSPYVAGGYPAYGPVPPYDPDDTAETEKIGIRTALRKIGKTLKWILIVTVILALISAIAGAITFSTNVTRIDALSEHMIGRTSGTNWLLVGSDSRAGMSASKQKTLETGGDLGSQRTDTIMLMHIPYGGGQRVLVSIPRDSYVNIPGYGMGKINSSFALGGPQLLVKTIEQAAGVHINHYMEIGLSGFADMTDAIDGVKICPKYPINDPFAGLYIKTGCQIADGKVALGYVRSRQTPRGDLDRVAHQREFLESFVKKATSPATMLNPFDFYPLMKAAGGSLTIDKKTYVANLAWLLFNLSRDHIMTTIPIGDMVTNEAGAVVLWNDDTTQFWGHIAQGTDIPDYLLSN